MTEQERLLRIENRMDRMEQHMTLLKDAVQTQNTLLKEINQGINGGLGSIGMQRRLEVQELKIENLEKQSAETEVYKKQSKWAIGVLAAAIIAAFIKSVWA